MVVWMLRKTVVPSWKTELRTPPATLQKGVVR